MAEKCAKIVFESCAPTVVVSEICMRLLDDGLRVLHPPEHLYKAAADGLPTGRPDCYASAIRCLDHHMVLLHSFEMAGQQNTPPNEVGHRLQVDPWRAPIILICHV